MKLQLIRNATMRLNYAGQTILTDPMLSPKDTIDSWAGVARNPTVELPYEIEKITNGIDSVLVSHDHQDHCPVSRENLRQRKETSCYSLLKL